MKDDNIVIQVDGQKSPEVMRVLAEADISTIMATSPMHTGLVCIAVNPENADEALKLMTEAFGPQNVKGVKVATLVPGDPDQSGFIDESLAGMDRAIFYTSSMGLLLRVDEE